MEVETEDFSLVLVTFRGLEEALNFEVRERSEIKLELEGLGVKDVNPVARVLMIPSTETLLVLGKQLLLLVELLDGLRGTAGTK